MKKTLGATFVIRNGIDLDFCFVESLRSILPICQQVIVSDCESTDGTRDVLNELAREEKRIQIIDYPFTNPNGDPDWFVDWFNAARQHLTTDYHLQIDADEVLHEDSAGLITRRIQGKPLALTCRRWNFWKDHRHHIPFGHCCGHNVIRVAPANMWMPSDSPHPKGVGVMQMAVDATDINFCHYGFIRKPDAFYRKERGLQKAFNGSFDPRLDEAEHYKDGWMNMPGLSAWWDKVQEYKGTHPEIIKPWLRERGYEI
jgi:hypothetical protein